MNYERLYEYRFKDVDLAGRRKVWQPIARFIYERMGRPRRVLDPAAGLCEFINALPEGTERWVVDEVDYSSAHRAPGVKAIVSDILKAELPASYFDGVFVSNFLEHLPSQEHIHQFFLKMHKTMAAGGRITVLGPNFRFCSDVYFDCADHVIPLTHVAVAEHLYAAGFEIESAVARFLPFSFRSLLPASPALTAMYLRMPLAWPFLGKQFLIQAVRR